MLEGSISAGGGTRAGKKIVRLIGAATAQQILDELRKKLADVDLKKTAPGKRARKKS